MTKTKGYRITLDVLAVLIVALAFYAHRTENHTLWVWSWIIQIPLVVLYIPIFRQMIADVREVRSNG